MFEIEMCQLEVNRFGDWSQSYWQTIITNCYSYQAAELALEEYIYGEAQDAGYDIEKVCYWDFGGNFPVKNTYKFINFEDPSDVQYSSYRVVKNNYLEEEVI